MNLPIFQSQNKDLTIMQTKWASLLNPLLSNPTNHSYILKNVSLSIGNNTINHLQGAPLNGYIIVGMRGGFSQVYDVPSPHPSLTLILNSSANVIADILVF